MKQLKWFVFLFLITFSMSASAEFFRYVDKNGNIHYTDDYSQVPEDQRPGVRNYTESRPDTDATPDTAQNTEEPQPSGEALDNRQEDAEKNIVISNQVKAQFDTRRQELDAEYDALMKEKQELEIEKEKAGPGAETQEYIKKAKNFNQRTWEFELKRRAFNVEIEEYRTTLLKGMNAGPAQ